MPTTAKGVNVFRACQSTQSSHPSDAVPADGDNIDGIDGDDDGVGSGDDMRGGDDDVRNDEDHPGGSNMELALTVIDKDDGDHEFPIPWSPSPPRNRSVLQPSHKRSHSAIESSTDPSSSATTPSLSRSATTFSKWARKSVGTSSALTGLTAELSMFGTTFLEGITTATTQLLPSLAPSPSRKTKAIQRAQELEEELDDTRLAALIRIFQSDVYAADAYMVIKRDGLRKAWIESTLGSL